MPGQSNSERTVRCPVESCDAEKLSRGIHLHVRQSVGDGHGPQGTIPEDVSLEDLETVSSREVAMDYPESRTTEQVGRVCPYCEEVFRGKQGAMVHLGRNAGDEIHPENPTEKHDPGEFAVVHVDEEGDVVEEAEASTVMPSTQRRRGDSIDSLEERVQTVITEFRREGRDEAADRLEETLRDS